MSDIISEYIRNWHLSRFNIDDIFRKHDKSLLMLGGEFLINKCYRNRIIYTIICIFGPGTSGTGTCFAIDEDSRSPEGEHQNRSNLRDERRNKYTTYTVRLRTDSEE